MYTTATKQDLEKALELCNVKFGYQLSFRRCDQVSKNKIAFTLKIASKTYGSRKSHSGRNIPSACWYAHGNFFDCLFEVNQNCKVISLGRTITILDGNWQGALSIRGLESEAKAPIYIQVTNLLIN